MSAVPKRAEFPGGGKTVLIVEDQLEMRAIHAAYLQHHGYRVLATGDGIEGLRVAHEERPDLILMDISVPGIDGIRATEQLKQDPSTRMIPVVIVSALPYGSVGRRVLDAGSDGWISKPCDPRRLLEEVRRRLGDPNPLH